MFLSAARFRLPLLLLLRLNVSIDCILTCCSKNIGIRTLVRFPIVIIIDSSHLNTDQKHLLKENLRTLLVPLFLSSFYLCFFFILLCCSPLEPLIQSHGLHGFHFCHFINISQRIIESHGEYFSIDRPSLPRLPLLPSQPQDQKPISSGTEKKYHVCETEKLNRVFRQMIYHLSPFLYERNTVAINY